MFSANDVNKFINEILKFFERMLYISKSLMIKAKKE